MTKIDVIFLCVLWIDFAKSGVTIMSRRKDVYTEHPNEKNKANKKEVTDE